MHTQVAVAERPVTQQGIKGINAATAGPGRQVQDKSYFMTELRTKVSEINSEIGRLRGEIEQRSKDHATFKTLSHHNETLTGEVGRLQGQLADLNLLVERLRVEKADKDQLEKEIRALAAKNETLSKQADKIFTEKKGKLAAVNETQAQIAAHYAEYEQKLNDLAPDKRNLYFELQTQNKYFQAEVAQMTAKVSELDGKTKSLEEELRADPTKKKSVMLHDQLRELELRKEKLESDLRAFASAPEERERLLAKVKEDNAEISYMDKQLVEVKDQVKQLREQNEQMDNDLQEYSDEKGVKYKELLQRDKEMQEFIDNFPSMKQKELDNIGQVQQQVVALMTETSRLLERMNVMPDANQAKAMQNDLEFKRTQMEHSKTTADKLRDDLAQRQGELEKMGTLDQKISMEKQALTDKIARMREELVQFADVEGLKTRAEKDRQNMQETKRRLAARQDATKHILGSLQREGERLKRELAENEVSSTLESLEQKLRTYEQALFGMHEYIENKGREANYEQVKEEINGQIKELNGLVSQVQVLRFS